ncbi:MAG: hypothetical protein FWE45_00220 [Firmicutes bacterium]|nr:hypothetical protein [Bacillota bacterium]
MSKLAHLKDQAIDKASEGLFTVDAWVTDKTTKAGNKLGTVIDVVKIAGVCAVIKLGGVGQYEQEIAQRETDNYY